MISKSSFDRFFKESAKTQNLNERTLLGICWSMKQPEAQPCAVSARSLRQGWQSNRPVELLVTAASAETLRLPLCLSRPLPFPFSPSLRTVSFCEAATVLTENVFGGSDQSFWRDVTSLSRVRFIRAGMATSDSGCTLHSRTSCTAGLKSGRGPE